MKKLLMVVAAAFVLSSAQAQINPMEQVPADKAVRIGRLDNGMTYYIQHNETPKGQACFQILHDVGSIQEADDQQGLAHFLEHLAFKGSKNLPGKQMISYLETVGVKFGENLNAETTWDYTRYEINDVPTSRQGIIDTALLVLHDWSRFIALKDQDIDGERGVIMEELRTRDGAPLRSSNALINSLTKGTKYTERNIIGSLEGLKSFPYAALRTFYETWYRPDYQAIFIVGDIDVDQMEAQIKKLMSDIAHAPADAPKKESIIVPDNKEPIITIFTDPEMTKTDATIFIKRPAMPREANSLVVREINDILINYTNTLMNGRLAEIAQQPNAPFLMAMNFDGNIGVVPTMMTSVFQVRTQDGKLPAGFKALLTEMERARRHGFTQGEFERAKSSMFSMAEAQYINRDNRRNVDLLKPLTDNYRHGMMIPDATYSWKMDSTLLNMISLQDVNMVCQQLIQPENWVVMVNGPEKEGIVTPTAEQLMSMIVEARTAEVEAYADNVVVEPLIADMKALKGSPVKKESTNATLGTTEWTLKNGTKIIVKNTPFKANEVRLAVKADGGRSIVSNEEFYAAQEMPKIMNVSGMGKFSGIELGKQLAGKMVDINYTVGGYTHGMNGFASPKDMETLLQLLYLSFTAPRFSEEDFDIYIKNARSQAENKLVNPDYKALEQFRKTLYGDNARSQMLSPELIDGIRFEQIKAIYDKLFDGANNFTFTFVGNIDAATLKPLVEKYIGSLPTSKKHLNYVDDQINTVKGEVVNDFSIPMLQPKVGVWYGYSGQTPYTIENNLKMTFLSQILYGRYLVSVRQEKGGTYGVNVDGLLNPMPKGTYLLLIQFDTNEQMADELRPIIRSEIRKIAEQGPQSEDVEKVREYLGKDWQNTLENNGAWLDYIDKYHKNGLDYITNYESALKSITPQDIQKFAQQILTDGNMTNIVMRPEAQPAK